MRETTKETKGSEYHRAQAYKAFQNLPSAWNPSSDYLPILIIGVGGIKGVEGLVFLFLISVSFEYTENRGDIQCHRE